VPFQFDDLRLIRFNFSLRDPGNWRGILSSEPFRPLLIATFALNYRFGGRATFAYHCVNLFLHLVAIFLFYRFLSRRSANRWSALIACAWMALHPLNTEAVTYISSRSILLCAVFYFASLLSFDAYLNSQKRSHLALFCGFFLFAMATKEEGALVPFAALLWNWILCGSESVRKHKSLHLITCLLVIVLGFIRVVLFFSHAPEAFSSYSVWLPTQTLVWMHYLRLAVVPVNLNVDPDIAALSFHSPMFWIASFIVVSFIICLTKCRTRFPFVSFWGLWFFLNLFASSAVPLSDFAAEHRVYISLFGFCAAASYGIYGLYRRFLSARIMINAALIGLFVLLACGTYRRNEVWKTEISLWQDAVQKSPNKIRPHLNLAGSYFDSRQYDAAISEYKLVKNADPVNAQVYAGLGICYLRKGDLLAAESAFQHALHLDASLIDAKTGLGIILYSRGDYSGALKYFRQTYPFRRESIQLADMMSDACMRTGNYEEAIEILEHALTLPKAPAKFTIRLQQAQQAK
jgi:Tfp pilus assembly protein PilF